MRRNVSVLEELYPLEADRKAHTLFDDGNFGEDGEFYLPNLTKDFEIWGCPTKDEELPEGLADTMAINFQPKNCPSLYCDLVLVHSEDGTCSYLGWNEAEKSYYIPEWLELLAGYLVPLGYHLDGTLFADEEYGCTFYYIYVQDRKVAVKVFEPDATYQEEFWYAQHPEHAESKSSLEERS